MQENILADIESLLQYHKLLGINSYPNSKELESFLGLELDTIAEPKEIKSIPKPQAVVIPEQPPIESYYQVPDSGGTVVPVEEKQTPKPAMAITDSNCRSCKLYHPDGDFHLGKGGDKPSDIRLLVIGDWRKSGSSSMANSSFGPEEDIMLSKMFAAMKLPPNQVFVTNLIKCRQKEGLKVDLNDTWQCREHLYQQIKDMKPEIICAMGSFAAKIILGKSQSLSQVRGKFYQVEIVPSYTVPVLATYHPSYLLKNEEMKRPTWVDLQKIITRLQSKKR